MDELLKFNEIRIHFNEHKLISPRITFFQFLSIHYFSPEVKDSDYAQDEKLPFKNANSHHIFNMQASNTIESDQFDLIISDESAKLVVPRTSGYPVNQIKPVFRPPCI